MTDYTTEEITAPDYLNDPKVLAFLSGTDADLDRLVLEEDGKLWAHSKRTPADLCRRSLEDMVSVAFPCYFMPQVLASAEAAPALPEASPVVQATPAPPVPRKGSQRHRSTLVDLLPIPVTGAARGLLSAKVNGGCNVPHITIDGVQRIPPKPTRRGSDTVICTKDFGGSLAGHAVIDAEAFQRLVSSPHIRADSMLWTVRDDGEVTTRVRGRPGIPEVRAVNDLLREMRCVHRVRLEPLAVNA